MATELDLELCGCVNGATVAVIGRALLEPGRIELDLGIDSDALHWDPLLAVLGLLDAALVLAVLDAAPDAVHLRRRTELRDENGRDLGHELLSLAVAGTRVQGQYVSARTRLEPTERATSVAQMSPTLLLPSDVSSVLLAGVAGFETDWSNGYRLASMTTGQGYGADGALVGPLEVGLRLGALVRERAALSVAVGIEVRGAGR